MLRCKFRDRNEIEAKLRNIKDISETERVRKGNISYNGS